MLVKKLWFIALFLFLVVYGFQSSPISQAQDGITPVDAVAWSPDGTLIAMGGFTELSNHTNVRPILTVRNAADMSLVLDLAGHLDSQTGSILSLAWSPDGKYLVSGAVDGTIAVWAINDPARTSGQLLAKFGNYNTPVNNVTWSPDGKWIASIAYTQQISIWNATNYDYHLIDSTPIYEGGYTFWSPNSASLARTGSNGAVIYNISSVGTFLQSSTYYLVPEAAFPLIPGVAWNTSGSQLALASYFDNKIYIYDFDANPPTLSRTVNLSSTPGRLAWSPNGTLFAFSGPNKTVRVVNASTGIELASYATGKRGSVENLFWKPDGSQLAFSSSGDIAQIVTPPIPDKVTEIQAVAWSPDGSQIAMGGYTAPSDFSSVTLILTVRNTADMSTIILDLSAVPDGQTLQILSVAWSPDGKYLVSGSGDGTIAVWAINDPQFSAGQLIAKFGNYNTSIGNVTWSPDGKWIASVIDNEQISIWNGTNNDYHLIDSTPTSEAGIVAWSPNSTWLANSSSNGAIIYTIASTGHFVPASKYRIIPSSSDRGIPGIAWNTSGSQLALASYFDNKIYIYDFDANPPTLSRTVNLSSTPGRLAWSPDGTLFAFSGPNKTARIVDANTGVELGSYASGKRGSVENLAWNPSGSQLAFSSAGDVPQIVTPPIPDKVTEIQAVAWSPDGTQIAMGGYTAPKDFSNVKLVLTVRNAADMSTVVLDLANVPGGQTLQILSVAWSPDGKYLVSGSGDGTIAVWAINDPQFSAVQLLAKFGNYDISVNYVTWSPDGKWIASVAANEQISIWNATNFDYHLIDSTPTSEAGMIAWNPNSTWLANSSSNGAVMRNISSTGHFVTTSQYRIIPAQEGRGITGIAWNTSGSQLALASFFDNKIYFYDFNANPPTLSRTVNLSSTPGRLAWSPNGTLFAFSGPNKTVRVVNASTGIELASYATGKRGSGGNLFWKPDGSQLAFSSAGDVPQIVTAPESESQMPEPTASAQR